MIVKIELIILSIIAILSFVTGVVINLIDLYRGKDIEKDNKHSVEDEYKGEVINKIKQSIPEIDEKTIVDIDIPRVKSDDELDIPVIIQTLPYEGDKK